MPTTPVLLLPYPAATDPADVPADIKKLGDRLDIVVPGGPVVTALPASPIDQQQCYLQVQAPGPGMIALWHLRYVAAAAGAFKWLFCGGSALHNFVAATESTTSTGYVNLATTGPSLTVPVAGDYLVRHGATMENSAGDRIWCSVKLGATGAGDGEGISLATGAATGSPAQGPSAAREQILAGRAASEVLLLQYRTTLGGAGAWGRRWISITPIRVG